MSTNTTTDPTDGSTIATSINATSTSTDANQRDHDNQDVEQSDKDTLDFECKDDGGGKS